MSSIFKMIIVTLFACFAFKIATPFALASNLNFAQTFISLSVGGTIGVFISFFGGQYILQRWFSKPSASKKKIFTKTNRLVVKVLKSYGLLGLAAITPPILSVPVGSIIAARFNIKYFKNTKYVVTYLLISVYVWALILSAITYIMPYFRAMF
jgi:hypothetical protein